MAQHPASLAKPIRRKLHKGALSAVAAMSFLKETRGLLTWTIKDLQKSLLIGATQAREVIAALGLQAYVKRAENPLEWRSHDKRRAARARTLRASAGKPWRNRSQLCANESSSSIKIAARLYKIAQAVAFGDFLRGSAQGPGLPTWGCRLWTRFRRATHRCQQTRQRGEGNSREEPPPVSQGSSLPRSETIALAIRTLDETAFAPESRQQSLSRNCFCPPSGIAILNSIPGLGCVRSASPVWYVLA